MDRYFIFSLRVAAVMVILVGFFGQFVVIPVTAADEVVRFPPYEPYAAPYVAVAIAGVACVQVALVAVWMLLPMFRRDAAFSSRAFLWVDVIIGSTVVATLLAAGATAHLAVADIPFRNGAMEAVGTLGTAFVTTCVGVSFAMLLVLMRGLLRKATDLQTEMSEVV
ncbi:DUF2975 domain-containing protein [Actinorugispora endophytica]|uniref:DUF2975 family protein n=1 Tax=Actinorugispora endophytica TaxID=1605990 RepID=A0A4R6V6D9_9ACTN|nr:DUF2975 domain-containing protein [Actinorugispora endophytica]TDQ54435.1 DUF2975 family protein [Actinorugispora endophytica]